MKSKKVTAVLIVALFMVNSVLPPSVLAAIPPQRTDVAAPTAPQPVIAEDEEQPVVSEPKAEEIPTGNIEEGGPLAPADENLAGYDAADSGEVDEKDEAAVEEPADTDDDSMEEANEDGMDDLIEEADEVNGEEPVVEEAAAEPADPLLDEEVIVDPMEAMEGPEGAEGEIGAAGPEGEIGEEGPAGEFMFVNAEADPADLADRPDPWERVRAEWARQRAEAIRVAKITRQKAILSRLIMGNQALINSLDMMINNSQWTNTMPGEQEMINWHNIFGGNFKVKLEGLKTTLQTQINDAINKLAALNVPNAEPLGDGVVTGLKNKVKYNERIVSQAIGQAFMMGQLVFAATSLIVARKQDEMFFTLNPQIHKPDWVTRGLDKMKDISDDLFDKLSDVETELSNIFTNAVAPNEDDLDAGKQTLRENQRTMNRATRRIMKEQEIYWYILNRWYGFIV